jgi:hypothetical protein
MVAGCLVLLGAGWLAPAVWADDIIRVEEDWELDLGEPDASQNAPQVTTVLSPFGNLASWHAAFDVNLLSFADYSPGGVQLQLWYGDTPLDCQSQGHGSALQTSGEVVTWTQRLDLSDGTLTFQITNGNSQTWGAFGNGSSLSLSRECNIDNLNGYDPQTSVNNSGVGFGGNRVRSLTLKAVRLYSLRGLISQDTTPRVVHADSTTATE